jgi:hypothetical protein
MLYALIQPKLVRLLNIKKGLLGSVESTWTTYSSTRKLIIDGTFPKEDVLKQCLEDSISSLPTKISGTQLVVVLSHSLYTFARIDIPADIQKASYETFVREKLTTVHKLDLAKTHVDFAVASYAGTTTAFVYAIAKEALSTLKKSVEEINLEVIATVPEQLAYYTLFEKTVRFDKREQILYAEYEDGELQGYYFDTFGPIQEPKSWSIANVSPTDLESKLKSKADEFANKVAKLNRIIISGSQTEKVRQDTFTKNVGVWTNPLKRIIPNFYQEYMVQIHGKSATDMLPILTYDTLLGAYVAHVENKSFAFGKIKPTQKVVSFKQTIISSPPPSKPMNTTDSEKNTRSIPYLKEAALFLIIFSIVFLALYLVLQGKSDSGMSLPSLFAQATPTPLPTATLTPVPPTPTPTVEVKRAEVKVRILNGTGVRGQAAGVNKILTTKGYPEVTLGNAANFDFTVSEVNIKKSKVAMLKGTVTEDIKDSVAAPKFGELTDTDSVDVEIILGKDAN